MGGGFGWPVFSSPIFLFVLPVASCPLFRSMFLRTFSFCCSLPSQILLYLFFYALCISMIASDLYLFYLFSSPYLYLMLSFYLYGGSEKLKVVGCREWMEIMEMGWVVAVSFSEIGK